MNYAIIFKRLTELGAEMMSSGGSAEVIPTRLKLLAETYGYTESLFIITPDFMTAHAIDPNGEAVSCVCEIELGESNFGKLNALDKYCTTIARTQPSETEMAASLEEINSKVYLTKAGEYIAAVLGGTGFAVMFGCNISDTLTTVVACILVVFLGGIVKKLQDNLFIYNAAICLVVETLVLASAKYVGVCQHPDRITLGVIMLLISGLGIADGLGSLMTKKTTIGIHKINNSLVGALGIAMGIALPLTLIGMQDFEGFVLHENFIVQTLSCTIACVGFGMWFRVDKKLLPYIAICACLCWLVYSLVYALKPSLFLATAVAAFAEGVAAVIISGRLKIIPVIITTVSIFPMIPGPNLFYMLYGIVTKDTGLAAEQLLELIVTCLAITLGFSFAKLFFSPMKLIASRANE